MARTVVHAHTKADLVALSCVLSVSSQHASHASQVPPLFLSPSLDIHTLSQRKSFYNLHKPQATYLPELTVMSSLKALYISAAALTWSGQQASAPV